MGGSGAGSRLEFEFRNVRRVGWEHFFYPIFNTPSPPAADAYLKLQVVSRADAALMDSCSNIVTRFVSGVMMSAALFKGGICVAHTRSTMALQSASTCDVGPRVSGAGGDVRLWR